MSKCTCKIYVLQQGDLGDSSTIFRTEFAPEKEYCSLVTVHLKDNMSFEKNHVLILEELILEEDDCAFFLSLFVNIV